MLLTFTLHVTTAKRLTVAGMGVEPIEGDL